MSGARHRRKGARLEREIVDRHMALGVDAERYPLSGASINASSAAPATAQPAITIDAGAGDDARQAFNYATLAGDVAKLARDTAAKMRNWQRQAVADIIDIGTDLLKVKDALGHGCFTKWLQTEFPNDKRTAQRFMQVAARFSSKNDTVSLLPVSTVYKLAAKSTPLEVVTEVLTQLEGGDVNPKAVEAKIEAARQNVALKKRQESKRLNRTKKYRESEEKRQRAYQEERERQKATAQRVAQELIEEIGFATIKRVLDAANDCDVHQALLTNCRELHQDEVAASDDAHERQGEPERVSA